MFENVEHWCRTCVNFAMKKIRKGQHEVPLFPIPVEEAFDKVAMDVLGHLPITLLSDKALSDTFLAQW